MQFLSSISDAKCFDLTEQMTKWVAIVTEAQDGISFCHQFGGVSTLHVMFTGKEDFTPTFSNLPEICYKLDTMGITPLFIELGEKTATWQTDVNQHLPQGWRILEDEGSTLPTASWEALVRLQHVNGQKGWLIWDNSD